MATAAVVTFCKLKGGIVPNLFHQVRSRQNFATLVSATTTDTAQDGEIAIVGNSGTTMIAVANGSTPDATATTSNGDVTSAGLPVPPGGFVLVACHAGDKINVAALP